MKICKDKLNLGDKVMTPISTIAGEIAEVKIEWSKSHYGSDDRSSPPLYFYKVRLPFQEIGKPSFLYKIVIFGDSELVKV